MSNTQNSPSTSTFATITGWIGTLSPSQKTALAAAAAALAIAGIIFLRRTIRLLAASLRAADDGEPIDPFTAAVTILATALSVDGMWIVFGDLHLVTPARIVSCGVLEASGFAFMRLARKDILAGRPATAHTVIVWAIAILSGCLSAGASSNPIETVVRLFFPLLAVQLLHSWFLPIPSEITLTQRQKGKRAWRYVKANRRVQRAKNPASRWIAGQILALESDRLGKRACMTGDATTVLDAAEQAIMAEALAALGVAPTAPEAHPGAPTERTAKHRAGRKPVYVPTGRSDADLEQAALALNQQVMKETGAPVSARTLARELRVGSKKSRELGKWLQGLT